MAPTPKTGLAAGLNKGHIVTKRDKKVKPSHSKGVSMQHIRTQWDEFWCSSRLPHMKHSAAAAETRQANKAHP